MKKFLTALALMLVCSACIVFGACGSDKVKLSFNTEGGAEISAVSVDKGSEYELPVAEREGYAFEGWYLTENLSGSAITKVTASEDATYYAKWAKLYTVTLNANGGSLSSTTLKLKEGSSLYEAVKDITPTKTDYLFEGWYNGNAAVVPSARVTSNLELTAKYKVKYVVEIYKESFAGGSYVKDEEVITGYGQVGEVTTAEVPADKTTGFRQVSNAAEAVSLTLSEIASSNVFKLYFDRETYLVAFNSNYPDGENEVVKSEEVKYGAEVIVPSNLHYEGYCLVGWANTGSGEVVYAVDAVAAGLYGNDKPVEEVKLLPDRDTALYAIWQSGYTDMFGGSDTIYHFEEDSRDVYLNRGGVFFKGEYKAEDKSFLFLDGDVRIAGKLLNNGTFTYYSEVRYTSVFSRYYIGLYQGAARAFVSNKEQIRLDGYNGIIYTVYDAANIGSESEGTFYIDGEGYAVAEFTTGNLAGQTKIYRLTIASNNGNNSIPVFIERNDDEVDKEFKRAGIYNNQLTYYTIYGTVKLDGFGTARYYTDNEKFIKYNYLLTDDSLTLTQLTSGGTVDTGSGKLLKVNGKDCYFLKNNQQVFTAKCGDDEFSCDGYYTAKYTKDGVTTEGYYTASASVFGMGMINFSVDGELVAKFIIEREETEIEGKGTRYDYYFNKKGVDYAEYNYVNEAGIFYTCLVLHGEEGEQAAIYARNEDNELVKISTGTLTEVNGLQYYEAATLSVPEGVTTYFPTDDFKSFICVLASSSSGASTYLVNYWVGYKQGDSSEYTPTGYTKYVSEDGTVTVALMTNNLVVIKRLTSESYDFATYRLNGSVATVVSGSGTSYYKLNDGEHTFKELNFLPYDIYRIDENEQIDKTKYFSLDGIFVGEIYNASYVVVEDGQTTEIKGKVVGDNATNLYEFVSEDGSLKIRYKVLFNGVTGEAGYILHNEDFEDRYVCELGVLELDGYGAKATLSCADGNVYSGLYFIQDGKTIKIYVDDADFNVYVDIIDSDNGFTIKGREYGDYLLTDNLNVGSYTLSLNGYGKLKVTKEVTVGGEKQTVVIDEGEGCVYTVGEDGMIAVSFKENGKAVEYSGKVSKIKAGNEEVNVFLIFRDDISHTYISTNDWSVFTLDGLGNAVRYAGETGTKERGSYVIITDDMFYYVNEKQTDAAIYRYNKDTGAAQKMKHRARGYYTRDMQSLLFSAYGFAVFNGDVSSQRFYDVVEGKLIVYRRAAEGESGVNAYGFIREDLGNFSTTVLNYEGKEYLYNDGYSIEFTRTESDKGKYVVPVYLEGTKDPVKASIEKLVFTPSGSLETTRVNGAAFIGGAQYPCTITCFVKDGVSQYYVTLTVKDKTYNFFIDIRYEGMGEDGRGDSKGSFEVTALREVKAYESNVYVTYLALYYVYMSTYIYDDWGRIAFVTEYDVNGEVAERFITSSFATRSNMYDVNGEIMNFDENNRLPYTYDEESGEYTAAFTHTDGYTYKALFKVGINTTFKQYFQSSIECYSIVYVTRMQEIEDEVNGYTVGLETVIASDSKYKVGDIYKAYLYKGTGADKVEIPYDEIVNYKGGAHCVKRVKDGEGKITSSVYYTLALTSATNPEENQSLPLFTATEVSVTEGVKTYYDNNGASYVDVDEANHKLLYVFMNNLGEGYGVSEFTYDGEKNEYTVSIDKKIYTLTLSEGKVTIRESAQTSGSDGEEEGNEDLGEAPGEEEE